MAYYKAIDILALTLIPIVFITIIGTLLYMSFKGFKTRYGSHLKKEHFLESYKAIFAIALVVPGISLVVPPVLFWFTIALLLLALIVWFERIRFLSLAKETTSLIPQEPPKSEESIEFKHHISPNFPKTPATLIGREQELAWLDSLWQKDNPVRIAYLEAFGGVGKTSILNAWMNSMAERGYPGASHLFAHSLYSQGSDQDRTVSFEPLWNEMLGFFGVVCDAEATPHQKAEALANRLAEIRGILILDGLEPLQFPESDPEAVRGSIRDKPLAHLLSHYARSSKKQSLILISTRQKITDLDGFGESQVCRKDLHNLPKEKGAALLKLLGLEGREGELESASEEYDGHAFSLTLLAGYLRLVHDGDVRQRDEIPPLPEMKSGSKANRMLQAYATHYETLPHLDWLRMIGLFDRGVERKVLDRLIASNISGVSDALHAADKETLEQSLDDLRNQHLILEDGDKSMVDAHPLVREYFGRVLEKEHLDSWQEAHTQLYGYFRDSAKELPDTLEEMEPLFRAVWHGCRGGLEQEALEEVYWDRIMRGGEHYLVHKLGAFGSFLACLSSFFTTPFAVPSSRVSEDGQAALLNWAAFALRALGRLREAVEPMEAGMKMRVKQEKWQGAATNASSLSELLLVLGDLRGAVTRAEESVGYAERWVQKEGDKFELAKRLTTHADALFHRGWRAEANKAFVRAETIQKEVQPGYHYLYSVQGFQYCTLLLEEGEAEEALRRAELTLKWYAEAKNNNLLDIALDTLTLGRSHAALGHREAAEQALEEAVAGLRKAGGEHRLPLGLLARAAFHLDAQTNVTESDKTYKAAKADLDEVYDIAHREMRLHMADYWLVMTRLALKSESIAGHPAKACWNEARTLIEKMDYGRRYQVLEELAKETGMTGYHAPEIGHPPVRSDAK